MEKIFKTSEYSKIKIGAVVRDVEDGDCWFEGVWVGNGRYLVTSVFWCGELYSTTEEDDYIGRTIEPKWWYLKLLNND